MTVSHTQYPQASKEKKNNGGESGSRYSTAYATMAAWYGADSGTGTLGATGGVLDDPLAEELDQMETLYDHDSMASSYARPVDSSWVNHSTPAASTEASYGSAHRSASTRSEEFWETVSLFPTAGHHLLEARTYCDYPPVPTGQPLSRSNYVYLEGEVTHPTPLEVWQEAKEPHADLAYRLSQPPAPAPAPAPAPKGKQKKAGGKRR